MKQIRYYLEYIYILKYKHRIIEICKIYLGLFKLYTTINITI